MYIHTHGVLLIYCTDHRPWATHTHTCLRHSGMYVLRPKQSIVVWVVHMVIGNVTPYLGSKRQWVSKGVVSEQSHDLLMPPVKKTKPQAINMRIAKSNLT